MGRNRNDEGAQPTPPAQRSDIHIGVAAVAAPKEREVLPATDRREH